ncbi:MAG: serine hydrolase [Microbacterium sp.]
MASDSHPEVGARSTRRGMARESDGATRRSRRQRPSSPPSFAATLRTLEQLTAADARVGVHVVDLDEGQVLLAGDDHVTLPVGALGTLPLLVEAASQFASGELDPALPVTREVADPVRMAGLWRLLATDTLPLGDLAILTAAADDALAANALLDRVGHERVTRRFVELGMPRSALLDRFREGRGPDDAPHVALGTAREFATLFSDLVSGRVEGADVSAQVAEWLTYNHDPGLVGAVAGIDPSAHDNDQHGLLFLNKTGRAANVRAEVGVLAGPRGGVAYALLVEFRDASILHRDRAHEAFRVLGRELMEFVA